jgi:hypothetical protein
MKQRKTNRTKPNRKAAINAPGIASAVFAICVLLFLPACKHKEPSNENSAAAPAPAANNNAAQPPAQEQQPAQPPPAIVNAGTEITVRLTEKLGSKVSQTGQTFSATIDKDVVADGQTVIPSGSTVTGKVVSAKPFGQIAGEASLVLRLTSVNVNNTDQTIVTSTRSFGSKIKAKGKVRRFFGGLAKRAEGDEKEVVLAAQSAYTFTLKQAVEIQ